MKCPRLPRLPETERIERAEQFFSGLDADIREGGSRAFYSPAEDYIQMPPFAVFKKADFRYSVLAHEITHWTGATTRLNRNLAPRFQKEAYAAEELIAELGSAFVCAELELEIEPRRDHAPYIQSWLMYCAMIDGRSSPPPPRRSKLSIGSSIEISISRRLPRRAAASFCPRIKLATAARRSRRMQHQAEQPVSRVCSVVRVNFCNFESVRLDLWSRGGRGRDVSALPWLVL